MENPTEISPTLAEFLHVPYFTKMNEEDIIVAMWHYILDHRLLIDFRKIIVDAALKPVLHPYFYWRDNDCKTENTIVMVYIAKMHLDPEFIERDVKERLEKIRKNIAARRIMRFMKMNDQQRYDRNQVWLKYLVDHYGNGHGNGNGNTN
jgi:chromatin remodeling complex protein RSC6